ncbi:MAG TPA: MiaB/RimO family radical SAM methylthiotransferase [Candidatus Cloacimonadota bacterium]|nr:MiaB/RimO family radical SAM methylthiotransferase [Candidatus Cloacimonadota bacterium]
MKYYLESLGCAKNLVDSERFAAQMQDRGIIATDDLPEADIILVNTCAFLSASLGELDDILSQICFEKTKSQILIVTGCVMNRAFDEFRELFPEVRYWVPLKDFQGFASILADIEAGKKRRPRFTPQNPDAEHVQVPERVALQNSAHVYLRIADGCENNCSYCTIPSIRGKMQSVPIEELVAEANRLTGRSEELVLIAQDSCLYGVDIYGEQALPRLIQALHELEQYRWIRIMYMHPDHFLLEWTELWKTYPKLLPYFEIPVQHGSDEILHKMNRKKGYQELVGLFKHIKAEIPEAVFRTTFMTGFPGEGEMEYQKILSLITEIEFVYGGTFIYSYEPGTPAAKMKKKVDFQLAALRQHLIMQTFYGNRCRYFESMIGSVQDVLIEALDDESGNFIGHAWFMAPEIDGVVFVEADELYQGMIIPVLITDTVNDCLFGRPALQKK